MVWKITLYYTYFFKPFKYSQWMQSGTDAKSGIQSGTKWTPPTPLTQKVTNQFLKSGVFEKFIKKFAIEKKKISERSEQ